MTHRRAAVWTERFLLMLILASLAGSLNLVLSMHRRYFSSRSPSKAQLSQSPLPPIPTPESSAAEVASTSVSSPLPVKPTETHLTPPAPPAEDPTIKLLAGLARVTAKELDAAHGADRRAAKLEMAATAAIADSERWKRRELLVRQQVAALTQRAKKLEQGDLEMEVERDVLAQERDALKAALTKAGQRSGNSILPYKGPNGTWRRPIVIECVGNVAVLQPEGKTFSRLELSPLIHPRSSPVVLAIAREMMHIQQSATPDGAPAVPYLVFLVRPNGIRPYYEARARLEPLGIAFGYELVEQDLVVDIPDFDDLSTWDGSSPLAKPALASSNAKPRSGWPASSTADGSGSDRTPISGAWPPTDPTSSGGSVTSGSWPSSRGNGGLAESGSSLERSTLAQGGPFQGSSGASGSDSGQTSNSRPPHRTRPGRRLRPGPFAGECEPRRERRDVSARFCLAGELAKCQPGWCRRTECRRHGICQRSHRGRPFWVDTGDGRHPLPIGEWGGSGWCGRCRGAVGSHVVRVGGPEGIREGDGWYDDRSPRSVVGHLVRDKA